MMFVDLIFGVAFFIDAIESRSIFKSKWKERVIYKYVVEQFKKTEYMYLIISQTLVNEFIVF